MSKHNQTLSLNNQNPPLAAPEWLISPVPVAYPEAAVAMEARVEAIIAGTQPELVWLLEHPPLYTAGTSADAAELTDPDRFPVYQTGRGGRYTYHGPGQRIAYVLSDLRQRGQDLRAHICRLENWVIASLRELGVAGERRAGRIGIWVADPQFGEAKIAAVGVRVRRWVTFHGLSLNLNPDLEHFNGIVPCGISNYGVTSLHRLGIKISMAELDAVMQKTWAEVF